MESNTPESTVQVLSTAAQLVVPRHADAGALWLSAAKLHELTGWQLKPEGLCKDDACVPLPKGEEPIIEAGRVCASRLWELLERPMLHDAARSVWFLGEDAKERARQLASLEAPDFTLPDIEGKLHSLSDFRGQKVLLATWASW